LVTFYRTARRYIPVDTDLIYEKPSWDNRVVCQFSSRLNTEKSIIPFAGIKYTEENNSLETGPAELNRVLCEYSAQYPSGISTEFLLNILLNHMHKPE
jgi:hypothetical protein